METYRFIYWLCSYKTECIIKANDVYGAIMEFKRRKGENVNIVKVEKVERNV